MLQETMNAFKLDTIERIIKYNHKKLINESESRSDSIISVVCINYCCSSVKIKIGEKNMNVFIGAAENCCDDFIKLDMDDYREILLS